MLIKAGHTARFIPTTLYLTKPASRDRIQSTRIPMQSNELYTQCEKLAASINLSDFIDNLVIETINSGTLDYTNDNGTSYGLPQLIIYKALTQYTQLLKTSIPHPLQQLSPL
jgi:hypothetical protein